MQSSYIKYTDLSAINLNGINSIEKKEQPFNANECARNEISVPKWLHFECNKQLNIRSNDYVKESARSS